jgi:cystathionine beta-lyase/cystathionine gamma-synthase
MHTGPSDDAQAKGHRRLCTCPQNAEGAILGPFDCWLALRGLKTMALRMERQVHHSVGACGCLLARLAAAALYLTRASSQT